MKYIVVNVDYNYYRQSNNLLIATKIRFLLLKERLSDLRSFADILLFSRHLQRNWINSMDDISKGT